MTGVGRALLQQEETLVFHTIIYHEDDLGDASALAQDLGVSVGIVCVRVCACIGVCGAGRCGGSLGVCVYFVLCIGGFHCNVDIQKALRCCQQDDRQPSLRSLPRFPSLLLQCSQYRVFV